jgi:hypothetical protein
MLVKLPPDVKASKSRWLRDAALEAYSIKSVSIYKIAKQSADDIKLVETTYKI